MPAIVVPNPSEAEKPPAPPEGETFGFEMIFDAGRSRAWANTVEDLIETLSPGYGRADAAGKLQARYRLATHAIAICQGLLLADHAAALQEADPATVAAFNTSGGQPDITVWASPIPLVLLDLHYTPNTETPRPTAVGEGNLLWFNAFDEDDFLVSLHQCGFIDLARRDTT